MNGVEGDLATVGTIPRVQGATVPASICNVAISAADAMTNVFRTAAEHVSATSRTGNVSQGEA